VLALDRLGLQETSDENSETAPGDPSYFQVEGIRRAESEGVD
jgi:hypothetical protein